LRRVLRAGWLLLAGALLTAGCVARAETSSMAPAAAVAAVPAFTATAVPIDARSRLRHSWRPGCPVALRDLRLIRASHWGFDGRPHTGSLVVHRTLAAGMVRVLKSMYDARYPIARMHLVDVYAGSDDRSMAANNTSAFNCRKVAGTSKWSEHAYGRAIDVNPVQNPYVTRSGKASPPAGRRWADRAQRLPGMIHRGDRTVRAFATIGWEWGGSWRGAKDYQHFSSTGS
jgi:D-alanyl-D-alanine carboxypeptidase-like protein